MSAENKEIKLKGISKYSGLSISSSKVVTLNITLSYSEIVTSVSLLQGLNTDVTAFAKVGIKKPKSLGVFTVHSVNFDKDGNSKVTLKSMVENVELYNIIEIIENEDVLQMLFKAIIELPGEIVEEEVVDDEDEEEDELQFV